MNTASRIYSLKAHGGQLLGTNFRVAEFACKDGTDLILIHDELVAVLQRIRNHFAAPVAIVSGYRTPAHNKAVGGSAGSYHMKGFAADIQVKGFAPAAVYAAIDGGKVLGVDPAKIGLGKYKTFTHVDVRGYRGRWQG